MRLIDADVFISYLKEAVKGKDTLNVLIMEAVIGMVNVMADNEPVNQWIPCSERLPEEGTEVLGTDRNGCIRHVYKDKSGLYEFATVEEGMHIGIVAWMPLPDSYKEDKT